MRGFTGFAAFMAIAFALSTSDLGLLTQLGLLALVTLIDIRSFNHGMDEGSDIVKKVWGIK